MGIKLLKYYLLFLLSTLFITIEGQIYDPVDWKFESEKLENGSYRLWFKSEIEKGWHIYSMNLPEDKIGPIPTSIEVEENPWFEKIGEVIEHEKPVTHYDPNFEMDLEFFENFAWFYQDVNWTDQTREIKGWLEFMVCDDNKCLPPEIVDFSFRHASVDNSGAGGFLNSEFDIAEDQILEPVKWLISSTKVSNQNYQITYKAILDNGWHIYSQFLDPDKVGPIPTSFLIEPEPWYEIDSNVAEGKAITEFDPNFDMVLDYFEQEAVFKQQIKLRDDEIGVIKGSIEFMVCDDEKCIFPPPLNFELDLKSGKNLLIEESFNPGTGIGPKSGFEYKSSCIDTKGPEIAKETNLWKLFWLGFGGGLIALLTPCVFPMIPLTVSFFTKGSENRKKGLMRAISYGLSIFVIYIVLSLPFHLLDSISPDILNEISTNVVLNVLFFVIFIVFAFSFFGYYELTLPSSLANKMDANASKFGGIIGIFFMAITLALVSFSCTGPILGSLLAGSLQSDGGAVQLTSGFAGFGFALALPFALFAAFPGWLNALPKSGGWLNTVKVILGFAELALAIKFLSNADLVDHWGLIKIEVFLISWILISGATVIYLLGKIKFPHDSPNPKMTITRWAFALLFAGFTIYLISGFKIDENRGTYKPLKLLSGLAPPVGYSIWNASKNTAGLTTFKDYEEGMSFALENNKAVLLDFTGYACVNCRKMEEHVWPEPEVYPLISENFVLISLYVDDKEELSEDLQEEIITQQGKKRFIKTKGNKWSVFQTETFKNNSQPYYALLDPNCRLLNTPVGYTPNPMEYRKFLEEGLSNMQGFSHK